MKRIAARLAILLGAVLWICVIIVGFTAYFTYGTDDAGVMHDGFGRTLSEAPYVAKWLLGTERVWVGWLWSFCDLAVFLGGLGAGYGLISWGMKNKDKGK